METPGSLSEEEFRKAEERGNAGKVRTRIFLGDSALMDHYGEPGVVYGIVGRDVLFRATAGEEVQEVHLAHTGNVKGLYGSGWGFTISEASTTEKPVAASASESQPLGFLQLPPAVMLEAINPDLAA